MNPISCNQRNDRHRKAFVPMSPTGSCSVSASSILILASDVLVVELAEGSQIISGPLLVEM